MLTWMPGARVVRPKNTSAPSFVGTRRVKVALHTTESSRGNQGGAENYHGHQSYPHFEVEVGKGITQFFPIDVAAKALANAAGGVETNRVWVIQIECVWRAANEAWPEELLDLVAQVIAFVHQQYGMPLNCLDFKGDDDGLTLASLKSPIRRDLTNYEGVCGHQHFLENTHWDPGHIPHERLMSKVRALVGVPQPPVVVRPALPALMAPMIFTVACSNLVLEVPGESLADGARIGQWSLNLGRHQQWRCGVLADGTFVIVNDKSGKVLDAAGPDLVVQHTWHGGANQRWRLEVSGGAFARFVSVATGKAIDVPGQSKERGTLVQQHPSNDSPAQGLIGTWVG